MGVTHSDGVELRVGDEVRLITPFVRRCVWVESLIRGGFFWELAFQANAWNEWTDLLLGKDRPVNRLRLTSQEEGEETSTEWRTAITDSSRMLFRGEALIARALGGDARLRMLQKARTRYWQNATASDVARVIAQEYGLDTQVEDTVERCDRYQLHETDWAFLTRLAYGSATESGRGDVFLWVDEGTIRLGAPTLQNPAERRHDMSEVENRVDSVILGYQGRGIDREGGATLMGLGWDWGTHRGLTYELDANQSQTHASLAGRVPRRQVDGFRFLPSTDSSPGSLEATVRARWGRYAPRYFSLRVATRPDLELRLGSILELQATLGADQETPFLGRFVVLEVRHELVAGSIVTSAVCYRREAYDGAEEPAGSSAENVRATDPYRLGVRARARKVLTAEELPS